MKILRGIWKAIQLVWLFFLPVIVDPDSEAVRAYLFPILAIVFTVNFMVRRTGEWEIIASISAMVLDKAISAASAVMLQKRKV